MTFIDDEPVESEVVAAAAAGIPALAEDDNEEEAEEEDKVVRTGRFPEAIEVRFRYTNLRLQRNFMRRKLGSRIDLKKKSHYSFCNY